MVKSFILMLQFLTRIPININIEVDKKTIARGTVFFPFVGLIVGVIAALIYYPISYINKDLAALGAVFTIIAVTGGFHVDGLSDTADGFFSSRTRERILEIMKDSRVGTFGVVAIVLDILLKYIAIKSLSPMLAVIAIILACGNGRTASAFLLTFGKSARKDGLGSMFIGNNTRGYLAAGVTLFTLVGILIGNIAFLISLIVSVIFAWSFMKYSYKVIGGITGDVCGAVCEICEILTLVVFLVVKVWI